jgi:hypothetical protein
MDGSGQTHLLGADEVFLEVNFHGGERRNLEGADPHAVLCDGGLDPPFEVVPVVASAEVLDQLRLVSGGHVVDPDRPTQSADDGLGQLVDEACGIDGVLQWASTSSRRRPKRCGSRRRAPTETRSRDGLRALCQVLPHDDRMRRSRVVGTVRLMCR